MPAVRAHRPSPLPWMLLFVSIALTIGVLLLGRTRLEEERVRTANALKANDELKTKLKAAQGELDKAKDTCTTAEQSTAELSKQLVTLELQNRRLQDELLQAKSKR